MYLDIKNKLIKNHQFLIMLFFLLSLYSAWINQLPEGSIIAVGDHAFIPDIQKNYINSFYLWGNIINGAGTPIGGDPSAILQNSLFYILDLAGISDSQKQSIKYFLFIFLSGLSMYLAVGIFFRYRVKPLTQFIAAIFYSFNGITIAYVSYTGVYGVVHDLYIFLPLIWSFFTIGLIDKKSNYLIMSIILVFLSIGGFQNASFLILLLLFLAITIIFCWITGQIRLNQVILSGLVFFAYFLVISFYSLHLLNYALNPTQFLKDLLSDSESLREWIQRNSVPVSYNLRFMLNRNDNFPDLFPYTSIPKWLFIFLSFYPAFIIFLTFLLNKEKKYQKWLFFFGVIYLFALFASAKSTLNNEISLFIFTSPVFTFFRSYDKLVVILPFISGIILCFFLEGAVQRIKAQRMKSLICFAIIFIILTYPLPFFLGKFHQTYSRDFLWDYKYSNLVIMPEYYKDIADYVNSDNEYYKIISMPYTGQIGLGWVLYPKWRYIGTDYTTLYYDNPVFSPVNHSFGQFDAAEYLHRNPIEGRDIFMDFIRSRSIRYLIVNKDVDAMYTESFSKLFEGVKDNFTFIKSFGALDLYRVSGNIEIPVIYSIDIKNSTIEKNYDSTERKNLDTIKIRHLNLKKENHVTFKKINPTKYLVRMENATQPFWLIFSESYHPQWDIYVDTQTTVEFEGLSSQYLNTKNKQIKNKMNFTPGDIKYLFRKSLNTDHILADGFANAWYIDPNEIDTHSDGNFSIILYFKPQSYFYIGLIISGLTLAFCIGYLILDWRKRKT